MQVGILIRTKDCNLQIQNPTCRLFHSTAKLLLVYKPAPNVGVLICQYEHQIEKGGWSCI